MEGSTTADGATATSATAPLAKAGATALATTALTKRYGHRESPIHRPGRRQPGEIHALEDLSIAVRVGEIFGLLGPNGAGKATTIRLLIGYIHASSGTASVPGQDVVRGSGEIPPRAGDLPAATE